MRKEEQPARSPWWLTALRLLLAAAVIFALAGPVFKPTGEVAPGQGPLLLVVDNGWASAPAWPSMLATAHRVVDLAASENRPIALLATAEAANQPLTPTDSGEIAKRLDGLVSRPWTPDYAALTTALAVAAKATAFGGTAWLSDGVGGDAVNAFAAALTADINGPLLAYTDTVTDLFALKPAVGAADALTVPVIRRNTNVPAGGLVRATDIRGRVIGEQPFTFAADAATAEAKFTLPVELRNDIVRLEATAAIPPAPCNFSTTAGGVGRSGCSPAPRSRRRSRCSRRSIIFRAPCSPSPTCASRARRTPTWRSPS